MSLADDSQRYLSERGVDRRLLDHLEERQELINTIHVLTTHSPNCNPRRLITPTRRRVLTGFHDEAQKTREFVELVQVLPPLESLSLVFSFGWESEISDYWGTKPYEDLLQYRKVETSELSFTGCMPQTFSSAMPHMFDLSRVTKLALFDCYVELFQSLCSSHELQNLTHFQLSTYDIASHTAPADHEEFFQRNQRLQHVYLKLRCSMPGSSQSQTPFHIISYLWPLHHQLKTFSYYDTMNDTYFPDGPPSLKFPFGKSLEYVCRKFCSLQQFGLQPPMNDLPPAPQLTEMRPETYCLLEYLVSLKEFSESRSGFRG